MRRAKLLPDAPMSSPMTVSRNYKCVCILKYVYIFSLICIKERVLKAWKGGNNSGVERESEYGVIISVCGIRVCELFFINSK